jgi:nucleoside-diphosphate-sugar epimerase
MKPRSVLIFGLGHLAGFLVDEFDGGVELWGTCRTGCDKPVFGRVNRVRYIAGDEFPPELVREWDVVVWNLPPVEGYADVLMGFDAAIPGNSPWIFVSATSVYGEGDITEDAQKEAQSPRANVLIECESALKGMKRDVSIVRPSGLVDEARHPANFLKGLARSSGARTPVNLVHTRDAAYFILHLIANGLFGGDFNLASDDHPGREEFYTRAMRAKGIAPPVWDDEGSVHRVISNDKSKKTGFEYLYPDLMEWLSKQ